MTAPVTRFDAERAVHLSLGAMSPLWPAYFVAASSSMAMWWLSRWTSPFVAVTPATTPVASLSPPIEVTAVIEVPTVSVDPQAAPEPSITTAAPAKVAPKASPTTTIATKPAPKAKPAAPKSAAAASSAPRTSAKRPTSKA